LITFDDSLWPLVTVTFTGTMSAQEFDTYMSRMSACLGRGEKYLYLLDTRGLSTAPNLEQRQRLVAWVRENESALRQRVLGSAFVITSPFIRLAMNIMCQLKPMPHPSTIVGDIEVARAWTAERFRMAGLVSPSALLDPRELAARSNRWSR
jgi:hypothetical protein